MKTGIGIVLGIGTLIAVGCWALTTKNEVVESAVFPLKVKLGLAQYKKGGTAPDTAIAKDSGKA
jgi:hypothetical protein